MIRKRATITDIARELKLSASTVSRALHDHPAISHETKQRIKELAKKLDYHPNVLALSLLNKKTNTIGVIVPEITSFFFAGVITGIQDIVTDTDYNILISQTNESYSDELSIIDNFLRVNVDGLLVSPSSSTNNYNHFSKLTDKGVPIVIFDRDCPGLEVDKVLVDDYDGAFQATDYLIKSGCKKVAHIGGPHGLSTTKYRLEGYLDALKKNNMPVLEDYIIHVAGFTHEDGIKPTKTLLNLPEPPDAIFAMNDCIAISAMYVAKSMNIRIPEELSLVGFDDEPHSSYFTPSLSTIWQPVYSMGMLSARILLKHLENPEVEQKIRREVFKPELVVRDSSRKI